MIEELECLRKDEKFLKKTMNEISFSKMDRTFLKVGKQFILHISYFRILNIYYSMEF